MVQPFRYFLTVNGTRYEANPLGVDRAKLKLEKEGNNIFFRRKFSGSLSFIKSDFQLLYTLELSSERCGEVLLDIERYCGGKYILEWPGVFSLNEVKWNLSLCTATVTPKPNDAYRCVLDHYGKEWNVLEVPKAFQVSANIAVNGNFEFLHISRNNADFDEREDVATWAVFLEMRFWVDGSGLNKGYYTNEDIVFRQVTTRPMIINDPVAEEAQADAMLAEGWTVISEDPNTLTINYARPPAVAGFTPFLYRFKSDFYNKYPDLEQWNCGDTPDPATHLVVAVNDGNGVCVNIRTVRGEDRFVTLVWQFGQFYFDRNRKLLDVLKFLVEKSCPATTPAATNELSDFFTLPINYATGEANKLLNLLIAQKSDIINYKSSEPAKKGMLSLKSLVENMQSAFDVYWFLNTDGKFQIEHKAYFESQGDLDLTVPKYEPYLKGKAIYEYETLKMPRYEKLTFSEGESDDFKQGVIEYEGACVNYDEGSDTAEKNVTAFTTDINNLLLNGGNSSLSGFVLIAHQFGNIATEAGDLTGQALINGHLAAANLLKHYHKYGRVLLTGKRNGKTAVFLSVQKTKKQTALTVPSCCGLDVNPFFTYITNLGSSGALQAAELNLKTNTVTLDIVHEISASGGTISTRQFDDSMDNSFL